MHRLLVFQTSKICRETITEKDSLLEAPQKDIVSESVWKRTVIQNGALL